MTGEGMNKELAPAVCSFVLRCHPLVGSDEWRIRVTYVQGEEETIVCSLTEAVRYMEQMMGRGQLSEGRGSRYGAGAEAEAEG
ncbi:hypothetical protein [Paenibacillus sp. 481]|uniref:hypothetical protein n=1 Tax=Paenibacillus sp. 481 TaxID=2835869 RepID=UPI001E3B800E|nr:hypothetical protein [Paenibacillus sp. 481]UHA74619.1 hypothetical protein KIK04_05905 [Paenibacillus sp. 481]